MTELTEFVALLLLVGFIGAYFWWIIAVLIAFGLAHYGRRMWLDHRAHVARLDAEQRAVAARADQQHAWALKGDERGVYGRFPPVEVYGGGAAGLAQPGHLLEVPPLPAARNAAAARRRCPPP